MKHELPALHNEFRERLFELYREMHSSASHKAKTLLHMIIVQGPVETVQKIMGMRTTSPTYRLLHRRGFPKLALEYVILEPKWNSLFSEGEKEIARRRLKSKNVEFPT